MIRSELFEELREIQEDLRKHLVKLPKKISMSRKGYGVCKADEIVVEEFGFTLDCKKCRGLLARDRAYQYVHHREECRTRMEALMREDDSFRRHVESADLRLTKRLADVWDRRDRESQDRKRSRKGAEQQGGGDGDLEQGHQPEVAEQAQTW